LLKATTEAHELTAKFSVLLSFTLTGKLPPAICAGAIRIPFWASPEIAIGCTELFDAKTTQLAAVPQALLVTCDAEAFANMMTSNCWKVAGAI
jgi:hypothetical protein